MEATQPNERVKRSTEQGPEPRLLWEAVVAHGGKATYAQIRAFVRPRVGSVSIRSIDNAILRCTVNRIGRTGQPGSRRGRTELRPDIDLFFSRKRGTVELYDPDKHGLFQILKTRAGALFIQRIFVDNSGRRCQETIGRSRCAIAMVPGGTRGAGPPDQLRFRDPDMHPKPNGDGVVDEFDVPLLPQEEDGGVDDEPRPENDAVLDGPIDFQDGLSTPVTQTNDRPRERRPMMFTHRSAEMVTRLILMNMNSVRADLRFYDLAPPSVAGFAEIDAIAIDGEGGRVLVKVTTELDAVVLARFEYLVKLWRLTVDHDRPVSGIIVYACYGAAAAEPTKVECEGVQVWRWESFLGPVSN